MIENGSRKTAPPDTARVKVHKYNLKKEKHQQHFNFFKTKDFIHIGLLGFFF